MFFKSKVKILLNQTPIIFNFLKIIYNLLNFSYFIFWVQYFDRKIKIIKCLIFKKKISKDYFLVSSLSKTRVLLLKKILNEQINLFKKTKYKKKFTYIEVGVFIGDTTLVLGKLLKKRLKKIFEIIAIDPFVPHTNIFQHDLIISRVYNYFIHNMKVGNLYSFLNHIKMRSSDSLKILKSNKIQYDFCFIDGSHKYRDVLSDIKNFSKIRFLYKKSNARYKGVLVGDDYEFTYSELNKVSNQNSKLLNQIKIKNINNSSQACLGDKWFHPGVTFAIHQSKLDIIKQKEGIWTLR
jgi:predicted O-methyltransferase YrrM